MVKWTDEQWDAISIDDKNMIVSAAAGSGKTAVLVERIKRLVIEKNVGIDKFLIVTFTKAAASEMKEKLIKAIYDEIRVSPKEASFLKRQLDLMTSANISTFHAFAMEVIRRYFYLIDLEPNFKIGDEGTVEIIRHEVLDQLFEDYFESESQEFLEFLRCYGSDRHERALKEMFLKLYDTIQSIPHPMEWLESHVLQMGSNEEEFLRSPMGIIVKSLLLRDAQNAVYWFKTAMDEAFCMVSDKAFEKIESYYNDFSVLPKYIINNDFESASKLVNEYDFGRLVLRNVEDSVKFEVVRARDMGKSIITNLKEGFLSKSIGEFLEDVQAVYPHACFLENMLKDFHNRFHKAKKKKNLIDFSDIEHYAFEILENKSVADEYREKFQYIFVDEYQDSNVMQDTLINLIKRENNLFVVGDIKQSIYKFRLAEPEIFQARYDEYANSLNTSSLKIDLNKNFRSKGQVIHSINCIFKEIMKNYDSAAALKKGDAYDGELDFPTELFLIESRVTYEMELSDELKEMKTAELEAHCIADNIKNLIGTKIFDSKKQCEREVSLKDIVILLRSTKSSADTFQQVFQQKNIPVYVDDSAGYFDTIEIQVLLNLLTIIDNKQQDIPLLSVLHSAIFDFSVEDLIRIRLIKPKGSYYSALEEFANQDAEDTLVAKCKDFFDKMQIYRNMAQSLPLEEFVWNLMWETGYYTYCGALPAGRQRQANMKALADKARAFAENGYGGIYGFLNYIRAIEEREVKTGQAKLINENDDLVRIMTIHKSKGLEFPIVIIAGLGKQLRHGGAGKKMVAHKDIGIGMTLVNYKEHWSRKTLLQMMIEKKVQQEEMEENIRILYVAMTRAKDRLILVGTKKNLSKEIKKRNSFLDYLIPVCERKNIKCHYLTRDHIDNTMLEQNEDREKVRELFANASAQTEAEEYQQLDRKLSFRYPHEAALHKKSKYSVTEYSRESKDYELSKEELKVPTFMQSDSEISATQKGTIMHKVMEVIDFKEAYQSIEKNQGEAYLNAQLNQMVEKEMLTSEELEYVEHDKIIRFFKTSIGRRAANAEKLYKEAEFNYIKDSDGIDVMVQGVIDCFFEENGKYILLDYKNSYINPEKRETILQKLKETYGGQIQLYKEALELIKGKPVKACYLYLFSEGKFVPMMDA